MQCDSFMPALQHDINTCSSVIFMRSGNVLNRPSILDVAVVGYSTFW